MSIKRIAFTLLLSSACFIPQSHAAPKKRLSLRERRALKKTNSLEKGVALIEDEYKDILKAYEKLKSAKPEEYSFYCNQFKSALIKAIEEENLGYKSTLSRIGYYGFTLDTERAKNGTNALRKFKVSIAPKHISMLSNARNGLQETELTKKADKLIVALKDMKRIVN